ncbi:hypothetical protein GCM10027278_01840 [Paralcaligenes ginsengisoli]
MQMRRVIDDIFVSYFYKQFRSETIKLGFYDVDSFQWLCSKKPFKDWPNYKNLLLNTEEKDELKRKRQLLKQLFIGENDSFLRTLTDANNSAKHSYFNTTVRAKIGDDFPTLLMNVRPKNGKKGLEEINVNLSQMIIGFTDFLCDMATRIAQLSSEGNIADYGSCYCNHHLINHYDLEFPRPA